MKKILHVFFIFLLSFMFFSPTNVAYAENVNYYLGGIPAGFSFCDRGAKILSITDVITEEGLFSPAKEFGLKVGDNVLFVNNKEVNSANDILYSIKSGKESYFNVKRNNEILNIKVKPVKDVNGIYKVGIVTDGEQNGIGTITFFTENTFASLGHPILDENKNVLDVKNGEIYFSEITGSIKGQKGTPGELKGIIYQNEKIGSITKNSNSGIFGNLTQDFDKTSFKKIDIGTAEIGDAKIYSTVFGKKPKEYDIQIVKTNGIFFDDKNMVIRITDSELLNNTGGIVQGMSGSPIIQKGKLVGAVTHVFINDPTTGYGIDIKEMINK